MCKPLFLFLLGFLGACCGGAQSFARTQDPLAGDVAKVSAKIKTTVPQSMGSTLIEVELTNRERFFFEPTVFAVRWLGEAGDARSLDVARVPLPRVDRLGRRIAPLKKLSYWLMVPAPDARELEIEVIEGCFTRQAGSDRAPVEVGAIRDTHAEEAGTRIATCTIDLKNNLDMPVDIILRVHCNAPRDGETLLTAELRANASGSYPFRMLPTALDWHDGVIHFPGLRIDAVEIVDWSVRGLPDPAQAQQHMQKAYHDWLRWDERVGALAGSYRYAYRTDYDDAPQLSHGRFRIDAERKISAEAAADSPSTINTGHIAEALRDLLRPSWEDLVQQNSLVLVGPQDVRIDGPGIDLRLMNPGDHDTEGLSAAESALRSPRPTFPIYTIREDRFLGEHHDDGGRGEQWSSRALGSGYVVVQRSAAGGSRTEDYVYDALGEVPIVLHYRKTMRDASGKTLMEERLDLEAWEAVPDTSQPEALPPTGPAADQLRQVWERIYRYPETKTTLRCNFAATNPGTDDTWRHTREVRGSLTAKGFVGLRYLRRSWDDIDFVLDGERSGEMNELLAFAVSDRIGMWKGRDPAAFEDFDVFFRGAEVAWDESARRFQIQNCIVEEITVAKDRVSEIKLRAGLKRAYTWKEMSGRLVATKIQTGEETLSAQWKEVAPGWHWPVKVEFRRVFGRDWGPETLSFSALEFKSD